MRKPVKKQLKIFCKSVKCRLGDKPDIRKQIFGTGGFCRYGHLAKLQIKKAFFSNIIYYEKIICDE